jgi:hypothetical protein
LDGVDIALRLMGAFYVFAGYVASRSALMSSFLDRAIAAIGGSKPAGIEQAQTYWFLVSALVVLAGGVALMALLEAAAWLFVLSALGQAAYLTIVAPRVFDAVDPPDETGRRQTRNAFVIYLAATAFVLWALTTGRLDRWQDANPGVLAVVAAAILMHAGYIVWTISRGPSPTSSLEGGPAFAGWNEPARDPSESRAIKVMADYHCHPLWAIDEDAYGSIAPETLELSEGLTRDLNAWADAYTASLDMDDPARSLWSDAQHAAHAAEARPLAVRLARELPDRVIYVLENDVGVVEVKPDDDQPFTPGGAKA